MTAINRSRRSLSTLIVLGATALWSVRRSPAAHAADAIPHLDEKEGTATALGYVEDAARAEKLKSPGFVPGSNCANCLQLQGRAGDAFRPCGIFPGRLVSAAGWCKSWTPEI